MIITHAIYETEQASPVEPVTLAEVKSWGNIDEDDNDVLITEMITGAREDIEGLTNQKLVPNDISVYVESTNETGAVMLPYGTPTGLTVSDIDTMGLETAVDVDYYYLKGDVLNLNKSGNYSLAYSVGITAPRALKEAIMMLVTYRYNNRGDQEKQLGFPEDVLAKVRKYVKVYV